MPGPLVHNGSLFTASLPARSSPALAIIPISCALSLLPGCTADPHPSCSAPVAAALLSGRGQPRASGVWAPGGWCHLPGWETGGLCRIQVFVVRAESQGSLQPSLALEEGEEAVPRPAAPGVPLASASAPPHHLGGCCPSCPSHTGCPPCLAPRARGCSQTASCKSQTSCHRGCTIFILPQPPAQPEPGAGG